jgi:hypothetical protein
MKKVIAALSIVLVVCAGVLVYWFVFRKDLSGRTVIPYIAHQKPRVDPHLPASVALADKLDEVVFDGLFNVSANPSGIVYEDGLGELMGIDEEDVVTIRLKPSAKWHTSYAMAMEDEEITVSEKQAVTFTARDLTFTLRRIEKLGSLSPDYILVSQALEEFSFAGPDENDEIKMQFRDDREWTESDIKEVLSFKILPADAELNATSYHNGTGPYMLAGQYEDAIYFHKNLSGAAKIGNLILKPFIDNSTYTTELKNRNVNAVLSTPFGAMSPILSDTGDYFHKSSIATCFFALFHNVRTLTRQQRVELRKLVYNRAVMERFFKIGTEQQRHIADYKGNTDNYDDYLNYSVFPSTSYYVEEDVVFPIREQGEADVSVLPDTVYIQTCLNYGYREELSELVQILNDPALFGGQVKVVPVKNDEIATGNYHAVLVPVSGYRSNFLFDLYDIFLREPDFAAHRINLVTTVSRDGERTVDERSFEETRNFFRIGLNQESAERDEFATLLEYIHGFMATRHLGDKQAYAQMIDELDQELALGTWLFSLPSLAYFSTQFDDQSIDLYGVASQLSTIENWKERPRRSLF